MFPVFAQARKAAVRSACAAQLRTLGGAIEGYANEHDGNLPPAEGWAEAVQPYLGGTMPQCPKVEENGPYLGFAYNAEVAGQKLADLAPNTVILSEVAKVEPAATFEGAPTPPDRHRTKYNVYKRTGVELTSAEPN